MLNPADSNDANACIPNSEALTCTADADGDGVINPFDPADADPCAPNPAATACTADADGDGVTDPFDPVDNNSCVPNLVATTCDADGDGAFPPTDVANQDPCVPNANNALCTQDADSDGVLNPADPVDNDACIPNSNALTCTADADNDGVANPFDGNDSDPCIPNNAAATCVQAPTLALVAPSAIHALVTGDTLTVVGTRLNPVTAVVVVRIADGAVTAASIVSKSDTSIVLKPSVVLDDSIDVASAYKVRVAAPAGTAEAGPFEAKRPRVASGFDESALDIGFNGEQLNPTRLLDGQLRDVLLGTVVPLTINSKSETFLSVHVDGSLVADARYQLELVYNLDGGGTTTIRAGTPRNCAPAAPDGDRFVRVAPNWLSQPCSDNAMINGSFELDFTSWTVADVNSSSSGIWGIVNSGTVLDNGQSFFDFAGGTTATTNCFQGGLPVTATDGGKLAFISVSEPDRHRAFQDIAIPPGTTTVSWDMTYQNSVAFEPDTQFIAINVRDPTTDALLATVYKTTQGVDPATVGMTAFSANIGAFAGQTVRVELEVQIQNSCMVAAFDDFRLF